MREALPDAELYVDANRGWTVEQALAAIPPLVDLGVRAIEEPIDVRDTEGRLRVAAASPVPLAGDESCTSLEAVAAARDEGAIGQVSVKAARTGFTESRRIAAFCTGSDLAVVVGSQYEGAMGAFASVALATALAATSARPAEVTNFADLATDLVAEGPRIVGGIRHGLAGARARRGRRRGRAAPSPGGRLMLFMAEMEVALPPDMDPAAADELKARERAIAEDAAARRPLAAPVARGGPLRERQRLRRRIARRAARAAQRAAAVPVHGHPGDRAGAAPVGARRRLTHEEERELWPIERTS